MSNNSYSKKEDDFNILYLATRARLFRYLSSYTKDIQLVEDIMQQCYLNIWEKMDTIRDPAAAGPLVRTYARNLMIDVIRRRMKEDIQWLEQLQQEAGLLIDPCINESGRQQLLQLETAIEKLPAPTRTVYLLHRESGLSYKEIAAKMSISVSMVEKHMSKAIRLLKKDILTDMSLVLTIMAGSEILKI
ncbi:MULTISPECIES: RNA polymerase sigma factor [unclassified Chitinophaga]|uniref:RNA polymerase sigma factor n=1 Tax=unclassified Chitinophaga TaxID=2619133 RepID=UPI00300FEDB6